MTLWKPATLLLTGLALFCAASAQAETNAALNPAGTGSNAHRPVIMAVGDGLTESAFKPDMSGWGLTLQSAYTRRADVLNRGFGGYYNAWLEYMLPGLFGDVKNLQMVIFFLGVKDSKLKQATAHYVSPDDYKESMLRIMASANKDGCVPYNRMVLITPPPICAACGQKARTMANSQLYVNKLKELGQQTGAKVLNIFETWQRTAGWQKYINDDGLHLSAEGNKRLGSDLIGFLNSAVPDLSPRGLPWHWPQMDLISDTDPAAALAPVKQRNTGLATCKATGLEAAASDNAKVQLATAAAATSGSAAAAPGVFVLAGR